MEWNWQAKDIDGGPDGKRVQERINAKSLGNLQHGWEGREGRVRGARTSQSAPVAAD